MALARNSYCDICFMLTVMFDTLKHSPNCDFALPISDKTSLQRKKCFFFLAVIAITLKTCLPFYFTSK